MKKKFAYNEVYSYFEEQGCELLANSYSNSKQKLSYRCSCGNISLVEYRNFRRGQRCKNCHYDRMMETTRNNNNGTHHFKTSSFLESREAIFMEKFGVNNPLKSEDVKRQREITNLERYGVRHVAQSDEVKAKQKISFLKSMVLNIHIKYLMLEKSLLKPCLNDTASLIWAA
ncbi:MAG: hypothetical protein HC888_02975 [Candidatus Competibacteraceae bacterium]|nr:hypothetical protein [Candidatus Competibacteraceae bacterium]